MNYPMTGQTYSKAQIKFTEASEPNPNSDEKVRLNSKPSTRDA